MPTQIPVFRPSVDSVRDLQFVGVAALSEFHGMVNGDSAEGKIYVFAAILSRTSGYVIEDSGNEVAECVSEVDRAICTNDVAYCFSLD